MSTTTPPPRPPPGPQRRSLGKAGKQNVIVATGSLFVRIFSSYGTVVVIMLLLALLTYLGTMEQRFLNIYDVQQKYFNSPFVFADAGPIIPFVAPGKVFIPLPGAYLLLAFLAVALIVGGIVRMRWDRKRIGILTIHAGMLLMLFGGLIEHSFSTKGYLSLSEEEPYDDKNGNGQFDLGEPFTDLDRNQRWTAGERRDFYNDHFIRDFVLVRRADEGPVREYLMTEEDLQRAEESPQTFTNPDWPFDIVVSGYHRNCIPIRVAPNAGYGANGFALRSLAPDADKAERHMPGLYATLRSKTSGEPDVREVIWDQQRFPPSVRRGNYTWDLDIRPRMYKLPFSVLLHEVNAVKHPGTGQAKDYSSRVSKIENDIVEQRSVLMNEPLRHGGFILYQSGYDDRFPIEKSTFAVNKNPADRIPLISCIIMGFGLLWHFVQKLLGHVRSQRAQAARRKAVA